MGFETNVQSHRISRLILTDEQQHFIVQRMLVDHEKAYYLFHCFCILLLFITFWFNSRIKIVWRRKSIHHTAYQKLPVFCVNTALKFSQKIESLWNTCCSATWLSLSLINGLEDKERKDPSFVATSPCHFSLKQSLLLNIYHLECCKESSE